MHLCQQGDWQVEERLLTQTLGDFKMRWQSGGKARAEDPQKALHIRG